jgi:hypothetical protein
MVLREQSKDNKTIVNLEKELALTRTTQNLPPKPSGPKNSESGSAISRLFSTGRTKNFHF